MACRGVHFAITAEEADHLRNLADEQDRLDFLQQTIEEEYFERSPEWKAESDKAWDAMHRLLAAGELTWDGGSYPLNHTVLAGELLYTESDYIMSLKRPDQVRDIAAALARIDEREFRHRYFSIPSASYEMQLSDEDHEYTWEWFQEVRELFSRAAEAGRYVLFTADQ